MAIPLEAAQEIASTLRRAGISVPIGDLRKKPVAWLRDAILYARLSYSPRRRPRATLIEFIESRSELRRCKVCGCTEDNACRNPHTGSPCSWIGPNLCSACVL